jgi:hypothetical protein
MCATFKTGVVHIRYFVLIIDFLCTEIKLLFILVVYDDHKIRLLCPIPCVFMLEYHLIALTV